jgi:hypothetical protein
MELEPLMLTLMLAGTAAYTVYLIEKRREEIRKTIEVIELKDAEFWEGLSEYRTQIPARA